MRLHAVAVPSEPVARRQPIVDVARNVPAARPQVGVGVLLFRDGRVLLGERRGSHGTGTWAPPGGHLEFGESVEACARREAFEETGLELQKIRSGPYTNDVFAVEGKHYVTLFVTAEAPDGEPRLMEPTKCRRWQWFSWSALPEPLFQPLATPRQQGFKPDGAT